MTWDFSCRDWAERLCSGKSLIPNLPLDKGEAERAVRIFDKLRLPDVPDQPQLAEAAGEWQRDIVRVIFGSLDDEGRRRVPELFAMVPKKSSKTTGGAAIMITALLMNKRPRAEFLLIGPTQDVADRAFEQASGMVDADDYLRKRFHCVEHRKMIIDRISKAKLRVKSFDMRVVTGVKPAGVLLDELHVMGSMHFASRVIGQIRGGLMPNPEAFMVTITTQSDEAPAGVFKGELDHARAIRDGKVPNARMLPLIYEFPPDIQRNDTWRDPVHWPMVLPNIGKPVTIDTLIAGYEEARQKGEAEEKRWASQHLNIEIGVGLGGGWAGADYWESAADESLTLDEVIDRSDVAVISIDGGGLDDLLGLAVLGRHKKNREWLLWCHAWAHNDVLRRRKEIAPRLQDFEHAGELTICDQPTQDLEEVAAICERVRTSGLLPEKAAIGLDPAGVAAIVDELAVRGMTGDQVVAVPQGWRLSGAVKGMERKLKDGTLWHSGAALMAWCVGNAKAEQRGNATVIEKAAAGRAKIDPLVAALGAVILMSRNPMAQPRVDLDAWLSKPAVAI